MRPFRAGDVFIVETRALPWAITFCPFGASEADQRINRRTRNAINDLTLCASGGQNDGVPKKKRGWRCRAVFRDH